MSQADQYDFENRMVQRTESGKTVTIVYDGDGNRAKKIITTSTNTMTTWFLVDMVNPTGYAQVLEELSIINSQVAVTRTYSYGHDLISQQQLVGSGWELHFYGYDGHGNTRFLTDVNGSVTDTYDYDAFGNLIAGTGSTANNYLFTGEQFDPDVGLYFLRARYHNTQTGRFWTMDTWRGDVFNPLSLHKYLYAELDPVNQFDPSGLVSSFIYGREVHRQIGLHFVAGSPGTRLSDRTMGTILGFVSEKFLAKRPDLIDLGTHELYEIKTTLEYPEGLLQLQFYLFVLGNLDPSGGWREGASYVPPPRIPLLGGAFAVVNSPIFGIITYEVIDPVTLTALAAAQTTRVFSQLAARAGQLALAQLRTSLSQAAVISRF
jgi:RHS repeat-associated protein